MFMTDTLKKAKQTLTDDTHFLFSEYDLLRHSFIPASLHLLNNCSDGRATVCVCGLCEFVCVFVILTQKILNFCNNIL